MNPLDAILLGAAAVSAISYAFGVYTARCSASSPCPKCSFHVNEQRMKRLEADRLRIEEVERQKKLRHDVDHKGWGWALGDPDVMDCDDETCPRNKKRVS